MEAVMKSLRFNLVALTTVLLAAFVIAGTVGSRAQVREGSFGVGIPDSFVRKYLAFRAKQLASGSAQVLRVHLGYVKGLSRSFTSLAGEIAIDLESGTFRISLSRLTPRQTYGVWLVDVAERAGSEPVSDVAIRLATVSSTGTSALATGAVSSGMALPAGFKIDRVVVAGADSPAGPLAAGSVNVFQKIFLRRLSLRNESSGTTLLNETTSAPKLSGLVADLEAETDAALSTADAAPSVLDLGSTFPTVTSPTTTSTRTVRLDRLISRGATLFFEGTFGGNGRTCGTCHPATNNFTIDPDFIGKLPANDPLFVAEFNPTLAQLERPKLMRSYGLILENLDGLSDPANRFVMRGVPSTLGMQVTLERDASLPNAPAQMTGWSGDGAPGTGSLREFAIGAVTQHLTRRLARVQGRDFRLPTEHQLDALEAFQLSLGRSADYDLSALTFQDANVETGRTLFVKGTGDPAATGTCGFCHASAGALSINGQNRNFNSNVEDLVHPAQGIEPFPRDGGFGQTPNSDGTFGDRSFNIAPVVEAADTAPFFHNNVVSTLEGVVEFYSGPEFNAPRPPSARFSFNPTQIKQIAHFMRAINVLQNIDVARRELVEILANTGNPRGEQDTRLRTAYEESGDAIDVLVAGGIFPAALTHLKAARSLVVQAQRTLDPTQRRSFAKQANSRLGQARNAVATLAP
jgi:cytochrome c peroxidase